MVRMLALQVMGTSNKKKMGHIGRNINNPLLFIIKLEGVLFQIILRFFIHMAIRNEITRHRIHNSVTTKIEFELRPL
jgi:hypothetical protein